jgi:predicted RNA binding protein YcfA (HicA-like mRNA interferase family)
MKIRDVIRMIEQEGWYLVRRRGVTGSINIRINRDGLLLPVRPSEDISQGTWMSIKKQAGLKE